MPLRRLLLLAVVLILAGPAAAQASQRVTIVVPQIERIQTSPGALSLVFQRPPAGEPFADVDASGTYDLTVNTAGSKITGALDVPFADGIRLAVRLDAPSGASSLGPVELSTQPRTLVADLAPVAARGLGLTYTASAESSVGPNRAGESHVVTYTITDQ